MKYLLALLPFDKSTLANKILANRIDKAANQKYKYDFSLINGVVFIQQQDREHSRAMTRVAHSITANIITFRNRHLFFSLLSNPERKTNSTVCFFPIFFNLLLPQQALHIYSLICLLFCFVDLKWEAAFCLREIKSDRKVPQMQPAASLSTSRQGPHTTPASLAGTNAQVNQSLPRSALDPVL